MSGLWEKLRRLRWRRWAAALALVLAALGLLAVRGQLARTLQSQRQAERWTGESDREFVQLSAFLPTGQGLTTAQIYTFRSAALDALASLDAEAYPAADADRWLCDAWSTFSTGKLTGGHGSAEATVIAVGGDFFDFHPLSLRTGSYLRQEDLLRDRIVLDEALAWALYGSADLEGLTVTLDGTDYYVAGVITRESDRNTAKVSGDTPLCFVCYDTWEAAHEGTEITCYELVCPEPVNRFSETLMTASFPLGDGTWKQNTNRFSAGASWRTLRHFADRGIQTAPVAFPYWENAAVRVENQCAALLAAALLLLAFPAVLAAVYALRGALALRRRLKAAVPVWTEAVLLRRDDALERRRARRAAQKNRSGGENRG